MPQLRSKKSTPELKTGIYRHYKGGLYLVVFVGLLEATLEPHVVYIPLDATQTPTRVWIRPLDEFTASTSVNGLIKPRYVYQGPASD